MVTGCDLPKASYYLIRLEPEAGLLLCLSQPGDGPQGGPEAGAAAPRPLPSPLVLLKATVKVTVKDRIGRAASPLTYDREGACGLR